MTDIIVGSVGVQLVPSAQGFAEKTRALLKGLSVPVKLDIDDKAATADLDEFTKRPREATVTVKADTKDAEAKIAALGGSARGAGAGMGLLTIAAVGLAPALIPATAAVVGLTAALSAPALAAGAGLAGFIGVAGVAITKTETVNKQIKQLSKQAETTTNMADAKRYQAQATALIDSLSAPQKALLTAQNTVSKAFGNLMKSSGPAIFTPLVTGMNLLAGVLPKVAPLLNAVSGALDTVLTRVAASVQSGALDKTIGFFSAMAGPSITGLAAILENIAKGFLSMIQASSGLGTSLLAKLQQMTTGFANIGQSNGFQSFLAYVQQVGPQVARTIGAIADAGANIVHSLAPLGGPALLAITGIAHAIGSMNPTVLGLIASSIGGIVIGLKAMEIITTLTPMVRSFAAALGIMDVAADANPVGAIVVGLTALGVGVAYAIAKWNNFHQAVSNILKTLEAGVLNFVGVFVNGAAKAFGWIPGIGPKLKDAASSFDSFRNSVTDDLNSIPRAVSVTVTAHFQTTGPSLAQLAQDSMSGKKSSSAIVNDTNPLKNNPALAGTGATITPPPKAQQPTLSMPSSSSYDPSLFSTPSTSAADNAAQAKKNAAAAKKAQKLAINDSLLTNAKAIRSAGKQLTKSLTQGLKDGQGGLEKYLDTIKSDIASKLAGGDISKAAAKSMRQTVNAISAGLKNIEKQYDAHYKTLQTLITDRTNTISSISSSLTGELDLSQGITPAGTNQFGYATSASATFASVSSVVTGLATRLTTFAGLLKSMISKGFPAGLVQEVANLGSTNGITVAQALLSGSKTQISSLSTAFGSITTSANTIGTIIGNALYNPGIQAQQGLLKGLLDDKGITAAGSTLAKKLTKAIRKALKIHSPSRLMHDQVGIQTGQGIGTGTLAAIDDWTPQVAKKLGSITPARPNSATLGAGSGMAQSDIERLAEAIANRPNILRMGDRDAAKVVLAGSTSRLATNLRPA